MHRDRRRVVVDVEQLVMDAILGNSQAGQYFLGVVDHPERTTQPEAVDLVARNERGEDLAQPAGVETAREQLDLARFARQKMNNVQACTVPVLPETGRAHV